MPACQRFQQVRFPWPVKSAFVTSPGSILVFDFMISLACEVAPITSQAEAREVLGP
jgi:hypothetical protein